MNVFNIYAKNKYVINFRVNATVSVAALICFGSWFEMRGAAMEKLIRPDSVSLAVQIDLTTLVQNVSTTKLSNNFCTKGSTIS